MTASQAIPPPTNKPRQRGARLGYTKRTGSTLKTLKASTQAVRRNILERFRNEHGSKPVHLLGKEHIRDIVGARASTPESANSLLKALRILLDHAVEIGMIKSNPAIGVQRYKSRTAGFADWTEEEIATFEAHHPIGSKPRLAFALALYTAQRVSDVVRMGWQHVKGDRIAVTQQKTGARS